jgi:hypothetical protein
MLPTCRTQSRISVSQAPERIRQAFAVTQPKVGAVCGKAARTVLCGGRAMKRTSLPLHNCDFVGGPLIALAASRLALRAPRRGGGFGHALSPLTMPLSRHTKID